jgi:hypothetical protein
MRRSGATNEEIEARELPMMLYVYAAIMILVLLAYRDWRAMLACCVPLTVATFLGYWFMKTLDIGLTVATLPVMVLATGIGVDYAFYIYNRLLIHLSRPSPMKVGAGRGFAGSRDRHHLHRHHAVGRCRHLVVFRPQVPGRHGHPADLHVHGQHGDGNYRAACVRRQARFPVSAQGAGQGAGHRPLTDGDDHDDTTYSQFAWPVCWPGVRQRKSRRWRDGETGRHSDCNAPVIAHIEKAAIIAATLAGKRIVAVGDYGVVALSDDGKKFRQAKSVPTRTVLTSVFFLNDKQGWAAGHDGTILTTADGGENWQVQRAEPGKDRVLMSIWFENAQHGLAVGQFGLALETDDGGKNWQERKLVEGRQAINTCSRYSPGRRAGICRRRGR